MATRTANRGPARPAQPEAGKLLAMVHREAENAYDQLEWYLPKSKQYARKDSNNPAETAGTPHVSEAGAAKSAADSSNSDLTRAINRLCDLPLSDDEKAALIRRLLAEEANDPASEQPDSEE